MTEKRKASQKKYYLKNRDYFLQYFYDYKRKALYGTFVKDFVIPSVLQRDGKCLRCDSEKNLVVHHKHYDLDRLTYYDLETLCKSCHRKEHKERGK